MTEEQRVAEAAMAIVHPQTDPKTRAAASQFLEEWTKTDGAWNIYSVWLQQQIQQQQSASGDSSESIGMSLLCLQLLQSKIRREVARGMPWTPVLEQIQQSLAHLLVVSAPSNDGEASQSNNGVSNGSVIRKQKGVLLQPASICFAALAVRCGGLADVVQQATTISNSTSNGNSSPSMPRAVALRILSNLPLEVEACADLTTAQVTNHLWPFLEPVLGECCHAALLDEESAALATEALQRWTQCCHVSLSQLNTQLVGTSTAMLPVLVHILSQPQYSDERLPVKASTALTEAIMVVSDACSDTRAAACQTLMNSVSNGFIMAPLAFATEKGWEDACHALASVICTLVTEEVEYCVQQPAEPVLHLLLQIQNHPQTKVGCLALECWLTVQEVPTSQRHQNWKTPLFQRVVECLLNRMAYPPSFSTWEDELDVDQSEFEEFRRMVCDVVISAYFLLRVDFVRGMVRSLTSPQSHWVVREAAFYALTVTAREVCARIKARGGGTSVGRDREETAHEVLTLAQHVCGAAGNSSSTDRNNPNSGTSSQDPTRAVQLARSQHWLVLAASCEWMGAYAATWSAKCSVEAVYQLLKYLCIAMTADSRVSVAAAKAIKNVVVGSATKLVADAGSASTIPQCVKETVETALSTQNEEVMSFAAEGCARLIVLHPDDNTVKVSLGILLSPLVTRCESALQALPAHATVVNDETADMLDGLNKYIHVLQVIIRFCERKETQPISEMMTAIWPFLETASHKLVPYEMVLKKLLSIHEQLLKNMPDLVAPRFEATMKYLVNIFEVTRDPNALACMASAAEFYGSKNLISFQELLNHVFGVLSTHFASKPIDECAELVAAFFQLCARFLLYCPAALVRCPALPNIVSFAVDCLTSCKGERDSTRDAIYFLTKFYSWRALPLPKEAVNALLVEAQRLDELLAQNGARLIQVCMDMLVGGSPILWSSSSDCVFTAVSASVGWVLPGQPQQDSSVARHWLESVRIPPKHAKTYEQVVALLLGLARDAQKNKAKAKLLLNDFSNICKGEASVDVLLSYGLQ